MVFVIVPEEKQPLMNLNPAGFVQCNLTVQLTNWVEARLNQAKLLPQMPNIFSYPFSVTSELIPKRFFTTEIDGQTAGFAAFAFSPTDPTLAIGGILIDDKFREQGLGQQALNLLSDGVRKKEGDRLLTKVYRSQTEEIRFVKQHHFQEIGRSEIVACDLYNHKSHMTPTFDHVAHLAQVGVRIVPLNQFPRLGLADRLIEIWNRTQQDQPQYWPYQPISAKQLEQDILDTEEIDYAHSFAAVTNQNQIAGLSLNEVNTDKNDKRLWCHYTAVDPDFRGRKLGLMLKSYLLEKAHSWDVTQVAAENDAKNIPMQKINHRLGFQTVAEWVTFEKNL